MTEREAPIAAYWQKTLDSFLGRPVRVLLADGRERVGVLIGSGGTFRVWTDGGPSAVPLSEVVLVEQV